MEVSLKTTGLGQQRFMLNVDCAFELFNEQRHKDTARWLYTKKDMGTV
jgi:hypothetical protein